MGVDVCAVHFDLAQPLLGQLNGQSSVGDELDQVCCLCVEFVSPHLELVFPLALSPHLIIECIVDLAFDEADEFGSKLHSPVVIDHCIFDCIDRQVA
ncbi:hypothetical protein [Chryseoglobus sp. 28M-23]|uniref:hypothetical protein n=1 Tax=Chryseoglobus sp. 28M-23 TaxID=2772253 RepID=UPI00174786DE|nr:hypothetical protein [Chryseoglobus sp. 28M-23]QOD94064.1 hypothetical protein IE160_02190 [Chryseoglobus sp. 28M-23]